MIILDEALKIAKEFIEKVSKTDGDWQLEEAALDDKKKIWSVTYSFWRTSELNFPPDLRIPPTLGGNLRFSGRRVYRTVKVDSETGNVIEMKAGFAERQSEVV